MKVKGKSINRTCQLYVDSSEYIAQCLHDEAGKWWNARLVMMLTGDLISVLIVILLIN